MLSRLPVPGLQWSAKDSLAAQLPERPIKIGDPNPVLETNTIDNDGVSYHHSTKAGEIEYVAHKGGRTCKVSYEDIKLGDRVVRLPTFIEVRTSSDNRLLRSARLFNYKLVDMTRQQAWEAAQAFARLYDQYLAFSRISSKDGEPEPWAINYNVQVDPDDMSVADALIAKYPLPPAPGASLEAIKQGQPIYRPAKRWIEPNDLRVINKLLWLYTRLLSPTKQKDGSDHIEITDAVYIDQQRLYMKARQKLISLTGYHLKPVLPEELAPPLDPNDIPLIRQLQEHLRILAREDQTLGGRLRALSRLMRLHTILKDFAGFEGVPSKGLIYFARHVSIGYT